MRRVILSRNILRPESLSVELEDGTDLAPEMVNVQIKPMSVVTATLTWSYPYRHEVCQVVEHRAAGGHVKIDLRLSKEDVKEIIEREAQLLRDYLSIKKEDGSKQCAECGGTRKWTCPVSGRQSACRTCGTGA